jgi:hypothetical protein
MVITDVPGSTMSSMGKDDRVASKVDQWPPETLTVSDREPHENTEHNITLATVGRPYQAVSRDRT